MTRPALLITGAAKRVGRVIATRFAHSGYDVALHYNHSKSEAEEAAKEIRAAGAACELFWADLADRAQLAPLVRDAHAAFPALSALVNNASVFEPGTFMASDAALYDSQFSVNATAPIFLTQAFAKIVGRGSVVNMLDTKITASKHSYFFYLLSKKTLAEFTKMAAVELAPHVRVNAVCPGHVMDSGPWKEEYRAALSARLPMGRVATLDEVSSAVYSLCENTGITGQFIFVDGGEHLL